MRGLFLAFEGVEGSGKSTHAATLVRRLTEMGCAVVQPREPGGTEIGEEIREILQHDRTGEPIDPATEVLLFAASRAHLVRRVIRPALEAGRVVVCDRFADSTTAYQGYGRGVDVRRILDINELAIDGAVPDATFLMDVEVEMGSVRIEERNRLAGVRHDRFEREVAEFHRRIRDGYLELARLQPGRFEVVRSDRAPAVVADDIWTRVLTRFRERLSALANARAETGHASG
jgi:dTMP kinase